MDNKSIAKDLKKAQKMIETLNKTIEELIEVCETNKSMPNKPIISPAQKSKLKTIKQIKDMGIISEWTLRRLVSEGRVPCIKCGNRSYINADKLIEMIAKGEM